MFKHEAKNEWENVYLKDYDIHYSRIIASWINAGGKTFGGQFKEWLQSMEDSNTGEKIFTEDQIAEIVNLAENGKMEWQISASEFLNR